MRVFRSIELIARERQKQDREWGDDHDAQHTAGDLGVAAAVLACSGTDAKVKDPLERDGWGLVEKHGAGSLKSLVIAGALIAAEIDRVLELRAAEIIEGEVRALMDPQIIEEDADA